MVRQRKRNRKFLGTRSHGKGNAKNRRGKGGKGGWGRAGMHKHRFTYVVVHEPDAFGRHGFFKKKKKVKSINLWEIEQLALKGKLEKKDEQLYFEFDGKVLGCGILTHPVTIKAFSFSENAAEKIKSVGGKALTFSDEQKEEKQNPQTN
jgi:large subunit ribosomal protein L15